jgi:hypothetical protein
MRKPSIAIVGRKAGKKWKWRFRALQKGKTRSMVSELPESRRSDNTIKYDLKIF